MDGGGHGLLDTTHFDTVRFPPPEWAREEFLLAARNGSTAYTPYRGNPEILDILSGSISGFLGTSVQPSNLSITPGTQGALFTTLAALVDPGDLVMLADPDYIFCERILAFLGARVERIPLLFDREGATLDLQAIESLLPQRPRLLLFTHPNNPTGATYSREMIGQIAQLSIAGNFRVLVDELYSRLVYDGTVFTHLAAQPGMNERCVTLLGPSKTESMSGYRVGVVVAPEDVTAAIEQSLAMTSLRAPAYSQQILRRWLIDDHEFLKQRITDLAELRELTIDRLARVPGLVIQPHDGTAYLFPDVSGLCSPDTEIAIRLQKQAGVIVSPGYQFGDRGIGHFRICYARDEMEWSSALDRMVSVLSEISSRNGASQ